ncbi:MAG: crotonase/enoyl-CoA hydratase family protein [Myxococcota bacterium]
MTDYQSYQSLALSRNGAIGALTLTGPGRGNAMGPATWDELAPAFAELDDDPDVRAVVVRGAGDHFSYGLDLMAMTGVLSDYVMGPKMAHEREGLLKLIEKMQDAISAAERCSKPVIAAIHGWCIGGGLDLAAACDVRICSQQARFSLREVKIAIVADLGSLQRLPAIIGEGNTRQLAFTGEDIDADQALQMRLVNTVYPDADALFAAADALAARIAENSPITVRGAKRALNYSRDRSVQEGLDHVAAWNTAFLQSTDLAEAFAAFMERRTPRF